jgi:hypothetical protein
VVLSLLLVTGMLTVASVMPANAATKTLHATLSGGSAGDPDGGGSATLVLHPQSQYVCFTINVSNITLPAFAAHIHVGATGSIVVPLAGPNKTGQSRGCVNASTAVLQAISIHPGRYYVNVHNAPYPNGAVRGTLHP